MASVPSDPQVGGDPVDTASQVLTVNLQVVSPSVGVAQPLIFPDLSAASTIKHLKEKIRQALPFRPADDKQRLIYRGRPLVTDTATLLDILGAETLQTGDRQTIHLVIRDAPETLPSAPSPSNPILNHPNGSQQTGAPQQAQQPQPQPHNHAGHAQPQFARRVGFPAAPQAHNPAVMHIQQHVAALQHQTQHLTQLVNHIQRDAMARALVNQNQRGRAHAGMRGIGDPVPNNGHPAATASGRASPAPGHGTMGGQGVLSAQEVQIALQDADASQATQTMANALHRSASSASLRSRSLYHPGVTTPVLPGVRSAAGSRTSTPEPGAAVANATGHAAALPPPQARTGYEVYVLSSPDGPRALLYNHSASQTFYTPRLRAPAIIPQPGNFWIPNNMMHGIQPQVWNYPPQAQQAPSGDQTPQAQAQGQNAAPYPAQQPEQQAGVGIGHPNNPAIAGLPPVVVQMWPHLWLLMRLSFFVWIFITPQASWTRWLTVISLAIGLFIYSSGIFNGLVDRAWQPLGRQVENMLPRLNQDAAGRAQQQQPGDPGPAQLAARLVAERWARENWFLTQYRRVERASLLFLASIAPGLAERHIANQEAEARAERERIEAEERAERERREAEEAAASAAAAAAAVDGTASGENAHGEGENMTESSGLPAHEAQQDHEPRGEPDSGSPGIQPVEEPLVAL